MIRMITKQKSRRRSEQLWKCYITWWRAVIEQSRDTNERYSKRMEHQDQGISFSEVWTNRWKVEVTWEVQKMQKRWRHALYTTWITLEEQTRKMLKKSFKDQTTRTKIKTKQKLMEEVKTHKSGKYFSSKWRTISKSSGKGLQNGERQEQGLICQERKRLKA